MQLNHDLEGAIIKKYKQSFNSSKTSVCGSQIVLNAITNWTIFYIFYMVYGIFLYGLFDIFH